MPPSSEDRTGVVVDHQSVFSGLIITEGVPVTWGGLDIAAFPASGRGRIGPGLENHHRRCP